MDNTNSNDTSTTEWCCGLPGTGSQLLTTPEHDSLRREARRQLLIGLSLGILPPLLFLADLVALAYLVDLNKTRPIISGVIVFAGLIPVVWLYLISRDYRLRAKGARRDLRAGYKKCFAGQCTRNVVEHPDVKILLELHLIHEFTELRLEVLPESQRIWRVNDQPLPVWVTTSWSSTENLPEIAGMVANL